MRGLFYLKSSRLLSIMLHSIKKVPVELFDKTCERLIVVSLCLLWGVFSFELVTTGKFAITITRFNLIAVCLYKKLEGANADGGNPVATNVQESQCVQLCNLNALCRSFEYDISSKTCFIHVADDASQSAACCDRYLLYCSCKMISSINVYSIRWHLIETMLGWMLVKAILHWVLVAMRSP